MSYSRATIRLSPDEKARLIVIAEKAGRKPSEIAQEAVFEHLARLEKKLELKSEVDKA
jgi:predicted transcriptional regulator